METIFTIGYKGRTHQEVADIIRDRGLNNPIVIDVRRTATGTRVARNWHAAKVREILMTLIGWRDDYHHFAALGNECKSAKWECKETAWGALLDVAYEFLRLREGTPVILLCAEVDPAECHRTEVAAALVELMAVVGREYRVEHLGVPAQDAQGGKEE